MREQFTESNICMETIANIEMQTNERQEAEKTEKKKEYYSESNIICSP